MSQSPAATKRQLRSGLRAQRIALPAAERMSAADAMAAQVVSHPAWSTAGYIAGYWATSGELPLHVLQLRLRPDQVWCLPCIQDDGTLRFAPWRPGDELINTRFGIPEPALASASQLAPKDMSVVLLPLVGFTRNGQRLGMGGGYYDRSFAFRREQTPPPWLIGIGYRFQQVAPYPDEPWDVPLDAVVTESESIICQR